MRLSPLRNKKKKCFLALDIGTEAVKALVFEKENQRYFIKGSVLQYFDESRPFDNDKVIIKVKEEAAKIAGRSVERLFLSFPPNILRSRVQAFSFSRQKSDKIISKEEAKNILKIVFKEVEGEVAKYFIKHSGILPQDIQFADRKILEIKIDGYEVSTLTGYNGKDLEFKVLASFLLKDYFKNFSKIFERFGVKSQKIVNPIDNLISVFQSIDGVFIDIGGEISQICLVKNGRIEMIDEIDIGAKDFSSALSQALGMRLSEARLLKERYSKGDLTDENRQRIKEILDFPARDFRAALKSRLKIVKGLLPSSFFLFGGGSQLPEIKELFDEEEKEIKVVCPGDFKDIVDESGFINNPQYISAILLCYAQ